MAEKESSDSELLHLSKILVPIDGSPNASRALGVGINLSKTYSSELIVLCVIPAPSVLVEASVGLGMAPTGLDTYYKQQEMGANHFIDEALAVARTRGVKIRGEVSRASKSIVEEIIDVAISEKIEMIVIGTRGLGGFKKLLLGSVSSGVVTHAQCNVLIVR
ncbi:MAG TPA: universal stress protein [Nitrososphaerales archaeon]|nr:universal stress protein [Nitrososphaerales archaeon]